MQQIEAAFHIDLADAILLERTASTARRFLLVSLFAVVQVNDQIQSGPNRCRLSTGVDLQNAFQARWNTNMSCSSRNLKCEKCGPRSNGHCTEIFVGRKF